MKKMLLYMVLVPLITMCVGISMTLYVSGGTADGMPAASQVREASDSTILLRKPVYLSVVGNRQPVLVKV